MPAACGRSSGTGQMRVSNGMQVCVRVRECELDGLRRGGGWCRSMRGIEVEKGDDEFPAIVQRCRAR